jgi:hypothetical protein
MRVLDTLRKSIANIDELNVSVYMCIYLQMGIFLAFNFSISGNYVTHMQTTIDGRITA